MDSRGWLALECYRVGFSKNSPSSAGYTGELPGAVVFRFENLLLQHPGTSHPQELLNPDGNIYLKLIMILIF